MAIRETVQIGEPILRETCKKVDDVSDGTIQEIITDLVDTMRHNDLIGLAANQIGENTRILVAEIRETKYRQEGTSPLMVCINPIIEHISQETAVMHEGCGSISNGLLFGEVERPTEIKLKYTDRDGEEQSGVCTGLLARVILHEYDHLEGVLFTDISDPKSFISKAYYLEHIRGVKQK